MFRDCYFEYAGVYSGDYNLVIEYISDDYEELSSGGSYSSIVDILPKTAEHLLYGIQYADNPLEFSVEIINPEENISLEKMKEIKEWLFGQDGWKRLYIKSKDYDGYYLKCLLIPETDITDGLGYRGLRCTIKNISGFWYREDEFSVSLNSTSDSSIITVNFDIDTSVNIPVYPIIEIEKMEGEINWLGIQNRSVLDNKKHPNIAVDAWKKNIHLTISPRYGTLHTTDSDGNTKFRSVESPLSGIIGNAIGTPLYLIKGKNELKIDAITTTEAGNKISVLKLLKSIKLKVETMHRIGGF